MIWVLIFHICRYIIFLQSKLRQKSTKPMSIIYCSVLVDIAIDSGTRFIVQSTKHSFEIKEVYVMTDNERKLLTIIREHDNPSQALEIAFTLLIDFLDELQASQYTLPVQQDESA